MEERSIEIEDAVLHEEYQQCSGCKEFFTTTLRVDNDEFNPTSYSKKCLICFEMCCNMEDYVNVMKSLDPYSKYVLSTPAKKLNIEVVRDIEFVSDKVKNDLIKYLESHQ